MKHALSAAVAALSLVACAMPASELAEEHELAAQSAEAIRTPPPVSGTLTFEPGREFGTADAMYSSWGIALSAIDCFTTRGSCVPARSFIRSPGEASASGVSIIPSGGASFNSFYGALEARFSTGVSLASVRVSLVPHPEDYGDRTARPWLEGYDAAGNLVSKAFGTPTLYGWQTVTVTGRRGAANITRIRFSVEQTVPRAFGMFDNVTFDHSEPEK
jgi:hypothetical protein